MNNTSHIKVTFYIRNSRSNSDGKSPIYSRITVEGKRAEISTNRFIEPENWNAKSNKVTGNKKVAEDINSHLAFIYSKLIRIHSDLLKKEATITAAKIKNIYLGRDTSKIMLSFVITEYIKKIESLENIDYSPSTIKRYQTTKTHIFNFIKYKYNQNDIALNDLSYSFIINFGTYLKTKNPRCNHNSSEKYIKNFRAIINDAIKRRLLENDPFAQYKGKLQPVNKDFLTKDELNRIQNKDFKNERLNYIRDIFLFSCYTGASYIDAQNATINDIWSDNENDDWIKVVRNKSNTRSDIPLSKTVKEIIVRYKYNINKKSEDHLLPSISNQKLNAYLKEIADLTKINKKLSSHVARHTFATTITLSEGVSMESVSSMLGHKSLRTTQIYAKIVNEKIKKEMFNTKSMNK